MNPIEHAWDALGRQIVSRQPTPQTLQEQERALLEDLSAGVLSSKEHSMNKLRNNAFCEYACINLNWVE
ncbi:hypothetical protein TNCV_4139001 [Trichonephila clavipes]|nr:hypothetical protein TNCV_4139001 [Trichonephila clavipes]